MVKYRRLSGDELQELEQEFKQYLITNGIYDEEWRVMNTENPTKAVELVDLFSDLVMDKALSKIKYIVHRTKSTLDFFWFQEKNAIMIGLTSHSERVDFKKENFFSSIPEDFNQIKHFRSDKKVIDRNLELFEMLNKGCEIVDQEFYDLMNQLTQIT